MNIINYTQLISKSTACYTKAFFFFVTLWSSEVTRETKKHLSWTKVPIPK